MVAESKICFIFFSLKDQRLSTRSMKTGSHMKQIGNFEVSYTFLSCLLTSAWERLVKTSVFLLYFLQFREWPTFMGHSAARQKITCVGPCHVVTPLLFLQYYQPAWVIRELCLGLWTLRHWTTSITFSGLWSLTLFIITGINNIKSCMFLSSKEFLTTVWRGKDT